MQYGLHVGSVGELADVPTLIRLAQASEAASWDGFSSGTIWRRA